MIVVHLSVLFLSTKPSTFTITRLVPYRADAYLLYRKPKNKSTHISKCTQNYFRQWNHTSATQCLIANVGQFNFDTQFPQFICCPIDGRINVGTIVWPRRNGFNCYSLSQCIDVTYFIGVNMSDREQLRSQIDMDLTQTEI